MLMSKQTSVIVTVEISSRYLSIHGMSNQIANFSINQTYKKYKKTDYSRHLDELSRKTDAIADKSVRSCLLAGKIKQAVSLLELRESFVQLQGEETKTIKEEIQLFVRKLNKLDKIWDYLSELDGDLTVKNLRSKAAILKENVENDGSLNAGGKFEWVDSVLIKCLQNGDWLLVDNVNLCSAAVLDRLNALLEPHGVLTIGERGVDEKGRMVEIRPHKEFRLFLTMDPKNGEISRAMRNRGVEIYILNERESATRDEYDLKSMVQINGLEDRKHVRALLRMHDFISDLILGEKPTINELLNAARQISQQIRYGTEEYRAFLTSLIEVYYKTRSAVEFDTPDVNAAIADKLKLELDASHRVCDNDWYNEFFTVRCERSNISSEVQRFQQQMALVHSVLKGDVAVDNENVLEYLMVMFYSISTKNDLQRRHKYVNYVLEGSNHQDIADFLGQMYRELTDNAKFSNDDLPLDCRWLPDSIRATRSISDINYTLLKLYLMVYYHQETKLIKMSGSKVKLLDYMKSRKLKKIEDKFNDVIVNEFIDLIEAFDSYLNKILLESVSCLTNESLVSILFLIKWRFSFVKCALVDIKTNLQPNKLLTNIKVHFNWFSKYAVRHISKLLNRDVGLELGNILKRINQAVDKEFSGLFKTGKNYQKFIDRPPPFTELAKIEAVVQFENISDLYNICNKRNKASDVFQLVDNERNIRPLLIDIKENYDDENLNEKIDVLKHTHSKNKAVISEEFDTYKFQLTPFVDYMEGLEIRRIVSDGLSEYRPIKNCSVIPTDVIATLSKYNSTKDRRLHHELIKTYFLYLNNCPSSQPTLYLDQLETDTLPVDLSGHHPKLTHYLSDLLINSESNKLSVCKLGNFRNNMNQLRSLNLNLWKNVTALQSNEYNFIVLESSYIRNDIHKFLEQLSASLNIKSSSSKSMQEIIQECVDSINEQGKVVTSAGIRNNITKFTKIILDCFENVDSLTRADNDVFNEKVRLVSSIHTQLGYLKLILNAQLPLIDPLTKKSIKKEYCEQAILDFGRIKMCYELQNRVYSSFPSTIHELHKPLREIIEKLTLKARSLSEYVAVRSENIEYETMLQSVNHALSSILSMESFCNLERVDLAIANITSAMNQKADIHESTIDSLCRQYTSNVASYESLILDWTKFRVSFPDIIEPLLCNVTQFLYGYKMKISLLQKSIRQYEFFKQRIQINEAMTNLVRYPVLNGSQKDYIEQIDNYTSENTQKFINNVLKNVELPHVADKENFRLLKCGIQEAFNACVVDGNNSEILNRTIYSKFTNLVKKFVAAYNAQLTKKEEAEKEAESLYKMKTKCQDLPEEEQIENELKELFPNFHTIDFSDMQPIVQLEDDSKLTENIDNAYSNEILYDDLKFVSELHLAVVQNFTKSEWLNPEKNKNVFCNFIQPLIQKLSTFKQLLDKTGTALDSTVDQELFGSFSVLLGVVQLYGNDSLLDDQTSSPSRSVRKDSRNFYKDADVDEVKSCFHILEELKKRMEQLLDEWPEQPTLKSIVAVIERIYAFEITSPVSRFLTGFEILLSKCNEWEQVAHSGVSLSQHEQMLTQQIICWRKKELSMWKNLLNSTFDRLNDSKAKWWLYLFRITEQFIVEKLFTVEELITTLQSFIINSNIAEFQSRLDLLFAFHCYAVNYMESPRDQQARIYHSVLWNMYQYYSQFRTSIANKIKDLRAPIEKKLKDYVKIVKWKDISYWSVKETVDKTHKILHKHVREFKEVLNQPVAKYLVDTGAVISKVQNVGIWDRPQRHTPKKYHYTIDASNYVSKKSSVKELDTKTVSLVDKKYEILCKIDSYFSKAKKLCKDLIENTNYPNLVRDLDEFVSDIIETSSRLQNLEVDTTLPRNKQKSQAKGILQQKHRALADLFRYLNNIGLSYRTGIVDNNLRSNTDNFIIKPVDLKACTSHIGNSRSDEKILTMWDSCEMYFVRSLIRSNNLETALLQPAKDLGLNNIERCRGYSAHLLSISHKQKTEMIEMSRYLYYLRSHFNNMSRYSNCTEYNSFENMKTLKKTLENALNISNQYKTILNTCPVEDSLNMNPVEIMELKYVENNFIQYKSDTNWTNLYESFNNIISLSNKTLHAIKKCMTFVPCTDYQLSQPAIIPVEESNLILCNVDLIISKIDEILSKTENTYLLNSLKWLQSEILEVKSKLSKSFSNDGMSVNNLQTEVENSSSKLLLVIQELYKKYSNKANATNDEANEEENQFELQEGHLKTLLVESLSIDMEVMNVKMIMKSVAKVVACVYSMELPLDENSKLTLAHYLSLLDQTILLYQYFFTQQVSAYRVTCKLNSILLSIFSELASKGFCVPPEFSEELGEEGMGKPSNGMGLGDGQGEKDVSDRIESEDQLDDARVDGQEKDKEEDADCKEEEKGIEMSEDFDSKLQDKEKKEEDEDESDDNSDSDAEEQMGETGKGANKLDEEIWGSDKEDDNEASGEEEGNQQEDEESGNKGEDESDKQVGAKEKDSKNKPTDEDKEEASDETQKDKKEINEMKEPEYDEDQVDPYHGNLPEPPEPEPMDLPDDLKLDDGEDNDTDQQEENPFDIDAMKEQNIPEDKEETAEEETKDDKQKDEIDEFSSDEEDINKGDRDESQEQEEGNDEKGSEELPEDINKEENNSTEEEQAEEEKNCDDDDASEMEKSGLDQKTTSDERVEAMDVDDSVAADKTEGTDSQSKSSQPIDELQQDDNPDNDGMGQSQMEENKSGHSTQTDKPQEMKAASEDKMENQKRKQKPGESDSQRSLGDVEEPVQKKLKTMDSKNNEEDDGSKQPEEDDKATAEMFKHIKDAKENATQVLDVATKEQAEQQKEQTVPNKEDEETEDATESSNNLPEEETEKEEVNEIAKQKAEKVENQKDQKSERKSHPEGEILEEMDTVEVEGDIVETSTVARGPESSHHTLFQDMKENINSSLSIEEMNALRSEVRHQMSTWYEPPSDAAAEQAWQKISSVTSSLAQELSEQLRLVLEPTQASRLKGDYRTGRRINMRKVIPYIASQFRKDKIWLRRTKPSKREYQIVLAIDDSSSMAENKSKEMTFESVALISKALTLLESGQLSIVSFGEQTEVLHKLTDQFTDKIGVKLLQKFKFDQNKTCYAKMVDFTTEMLSQSQMLSSSLTAKLLIIISDGHGVFSQGETLMRQAVRRGKLANIFTIFVIIDNPENKHSVLDVKMPLFQGNKLIKIDNYMDKFPFSFYIILRDLVSLPNVLSDALRQWFELVSNSDKQ
ncbi:hypothetical protein WA026_003241 [Henosepilachna vigintioctopunctata]|uniref:VWFA domain-containing protein n=1 Tax=Henosepilachna vigintioctopunctata TaxID=420089 RepID=A0AAW1THA7_9CUCU